MEQCGHQGQKVGAASALMFSLLLFLVTMWGGGGIYVCGYVHVSKVPIDPIVIRLTPVLGTELRSPRGAAVFSAAVISPHRVLASSVIVRAWSLNSQLAAVLTDQPGILMLCVLVVGRYRSTRNLTIHGGHQALPGQAFPWYPLHSVPG